MTDNRTKWNDGIAKEFCEIIADAKTIKYACGIVDISPMTINRKKNPKSDYYDEDFAVAFEQAMLDSSYIFADNAVEAANDKAGDFFTNVTKDGREYKAPNSANVQRHKLMADMAMKQAQIRNKRFRLNDQTTLNNTVIPYTVTNFGDKKKTVVTQEGALQKHKSVLEKIRSQSNN